MRVISKWQDYYDVIMRQGMDQSCTWIRDCKMNGDRIKLPYLHLNFVNAETYTFRYMIGFCGNLYPCIEIKYGQDYSRKSKYCYSSEDVRKFVEEIYPKYYANYMKPPKSKRYSIRRKLGLDRKSIDLYFKESSEIKTDLFVKYACPVFIIIGYMDTWNSASKYNGNIIFHGPRKLEGNITDADWRDALLDKRQFYRIFPTDQAYQEIYMYLSGVLGVGNPIVPVPSDKIKRDLHGFDKHSFKTRKDRKKK